jgi:hypothetical protein
MKLRALFVLLLVLVAGAVAIWFWPAESQKAVAPAPAVPPPLAASPAPITAAVTTPSSPTPQPGSAPVGPTPPVRFDSPVMPGQPVYRSNPVAAQKPAAAAPAAPPSAPPLPPAMKEPDGKEDIENVRSMFSNYVARMGEIPVGTNAEIMKAVMGGNRDRLTLGPPHGQSLNEKGELVDQWGTPYFFHQLARDSMEVRSAGPDMQMWTQDDIVTR